ncbi:MAG: UPF0175 family protein [Bacteroidetes bacterium]|nr:UPF0175 family protein [Bacteroidota bacterium]
MNMKQVSFSIPEQLIFSLNENISEFTDNIRLFAALQFFKMHKLSLGKAAELANMDKFSFIHQLGKFKIPIIDYDPEELEKELLRFKNDNRS